jgi:integrase
VIVEDKSTQVLVIPWGSDHSPVGRSRKSPARHSPTHNSLKKKKKSGRKEKQALRQERKKEKKDKVEKEKEKKKEQLEIIHGIQPLSDRAVSILEEYTSSYLQKIVNVLVPWTSWFQSKPSWCGKSAMDETVCEFLKTIRMEYKPNTLWSKMSFLKKFLFATEGIAEDARTSYPKTTSFLKKNSDGYEPESAREFTMVGPRRIQLFWAQKNPDNATLLRIVASMASVFTATRSEEAHSILMKDVRIRGDFEVEVTSNRVKRNKIEQEHLILSTEEYSAGKIFDAYKRLAHPDPEVDGPFFLQVHNLSRSFTATACAAVFWTTVARDIALWLGYSDEEVYEFSSHSFRSTCATAMAENNADESRIALHGNWKSTKVMRERYIRKTDLFRRGNAEFILGKENVVSEKKDEKTKKRKRETVMVLPAKKICISYDEEATSFVVKLCN